MNGKKVSGKNFKIAAIQMSMTDNTAENMKKGAMFCEEAAANGAQVISLPELYSSQYFCQKEDALYFDLAEPVDGPSFEQFSRVAAKNSVAIVVPFFEKRASGIYHNSALVIDSDGRLAGLYRKMHIPDDPSYYEKFYFTPGDLGFKSIDTAFGRIGTLICWDQWYPEGARLTALQGASVLFYPTAIGWHPYEKASHGEQQRDAWFTVQRGHAIANGIYVAAANRVGHERTVKDQPGIEFWGTSFICDPQGVVIAKASTDREEIIYADIDMSHIEEIRRNWPFFRDRRIDAYSDITKRFID